MITYEEALKLLKKYFEEGSSTFSHSKAVSDFLYEICSKPSKLHPELGIDPEKMRIVGLLHDIGRARCQERDQVLHPFESGKMLREHGLNDMAKIVERHGIANEIAELRGMRGDFSPRNIEDELLIYADFHFKGDRFVSLQERLRDLKERSKDNPERLKALEMCEERMERIMKKIEKLCYSET